MLGLDDTKPRIIEYKLVGQRGTLPVIFYAGEVWLSPRQISELYRLQASTVSEHLKKITASRDYPAAEYTHKFRATGLDGKSYLVTHYRLEVVEEFGRRSRKNELLVT